jgi:lipid-A-disaccharide synthase
LVNTPFIGLPNIVAKKLIVKELIQHEAIPETLSDEILRILLDKSYAQEMQQHLQQVKEQLGTGGGSKNMAELALEMLNE